MTPQPAIVVNFRSFATGCDEPVLCTVEVADTGLQQGQGMHGSFSRADTMNFMAAIGPDFKAGFVDEAPVSNADIGKTIAHVLGLKIADQGRAGRPRASTKRCRAARSPTSRALRRALAARRATGCVTVLNRSARRRHALFRRRRISRPHRRPGRGTQGRQPLTPDRPPRRKIFHLPGAAVRQRLCSVPRRRRDAIDALCARPYSAPVCGRLY